MKKMTKINSSLSVLLVMLIASLTSIHADINVPDLRFGNIRQMGMGGTGVAISEDDSALYTNPAALTKLGSLHVKFPRARMGANTDFLDKVSDVMNLADNGDDNAQLNALKDLVPLQMGLELGIDPIISVTMKGLGVGIFTGGRIVSSLKDKITPKLEIDGAIDMAGIIGYGTEVEILEQECSIGISAKMINRNIFFNNQSGEEIYTLEQADILKMINDQEGKPGNPDIYTLSGLGIDLGLLTPFKSFLGEGQFGIALHNLGASLSGDKELVTSQNVLVESQSLTRELPVTCVIGLGVKTKLPEFIPVVADFVGDFTLAADYKIISPESSFFKNLHLGAEKQVLGGLLTLRGGINQGVIVGGVGVNLFVLHVDYAYYAEELGQEIGMDKVEYHIVQLGLFF